MINNCLSSDEETEASDDYDTCKEIQKFLLKNLQLTPRRQLFEEYEKKLITSGKSEQISVQKRNNETHEPINKYELNVVNELSEFRRKYSKECMTDLNHRRFRRAKEREEEFLHHAGVQCSVLNQGFIQSIIKASRENETKLKDSTTKAASDKMHTRVRNVHFAPDNSLALSYQKFKL